MFSDCILNNADYIFEDGENPPKKLPIFLQPDRRERIAVEVINVLLSSGRVDQSDVARQAVKLADELIAELDKEG